MYVLSFAIVIVSGVLYQVTQKLIPSGINPAFSLLCSYVTAIVLALVLFIIFPMKSNSVIESLKTVNVFSFFLAVPTIGIAIGYLLLYRAGGNVSISSAIVQAFVTVILIIVGIVIFKEKLNLKKILGIIMCLSGLFLANSK